MIDLSALEGITLETTYAEILGELKQKYQTATGKTLYPSDDVTFLLEIIAYQRILMEYAFLHESRQNLLAFATGNRLDHIGAMFGLQRLQPTHATASFQLSFVPRTTSITVPQGFQVAKDDIVFETSFAHTITTDQASIQVPMQCTQAGIIGNGYVAGEVSQIVQPFTAMSAAQNVTITAGGADTESDDHFRNRIQLFPEALSAAGPENAYIFLTQSCHPDIIDVAVTTPTISLVDLVEQVDGYLNTGTPAAEIALYLRPQMPGTVNIYPLLKGGQLPTTEMIVDIQNQIDTSNKKPLCDIVNVQQPESVPFDINIQIQAPDTKLHTQIQNEATSRMNDICAQWKSKLGQDIIPEVLLAACQNVPGAYRTTVNSPDFQTLEDSQFPLVGTVTIEVVVQ